MAIKDLGNQANLYDSFQILVGLQLNIQNVISDYQKRINNAVTSIQSNPLFPTVSPEEQDYVTSMVQAVATAFSSMGIPVNPDQPAIPVPPPEPGPGPTP